MANGYFNVQSLPKQPYIKLQDFSMIDSMKKLNGIIKASVKSYTPIVFSSGEFYSKEGNVFYPLKREDGKIVIPGTSIKGTIRTYAEALSYSCHLDPQNICGNDENKNLCIDCSIFGTSGFGTSGKKFSTIGKVHFNDVFVDQKSLKLTQVGLPRQYKGRGSNGQLRIYSHKITVNNFHDFQYEAIDARNTFEFEIEFHGMDEKELGLLVLAMGCDKDNSFGVKFGHGKSQGYGSAKIEIKELWMVSKNIFENIKIQDASCLYEYSKQYLKYVNSDVIKNNLEKIKNDWGEAFNGQMSNLERRT